MLTAPPTRPDETGKALLVVAADAVLGLSAVAKPLPFSSCAGVAVFEVAPGVVVVVVVAEAEEGVTVEEVVVEEAVEGVAEEEEEVVEVAADEVDAGAV